MRHLTTAQGAFHGRVLAARLGAEGVLVELRGMAEGPYPIQGTVEVYVDGDQLELAREILLADAVDAAFEESDVLGAGSDALPGRAPGSPHGQGSAQRDRVRLISTALAILVVVALLLTAVVVLG